MSKPTTEQRFWLKVDRVWHCWLWTAYCDRDGYGRFTNAGKRVFAHRYAYELMVGEIPTGLEPDHLCLRKACVNPDHLELVTHAENTLRWSLTITHCVNGHEYTPENTHWKGPNERGRRRCLACLRGTYQVSV